MSINDLPPRDFDRFARQQREQEALKPKMCKRREIEAREERAQLARDCGVTLEELAELQKGID